MLSLTYLAPSCPLALRQLPQHLSLPVAPPGTGARLHPATMGIKTALYGIPGIIGDYVEQEELVSAEEPVIIDFITEPWLSQPQSPTPAMTKAPHIDNYSSDLKAEIWQHVFFLQSCLTHLYRFAIYSVNLTNMEMVCLSSALWIQRSHNLMKQKLPKITQITGRIALDRVQLIVKPWISWIIARSALWLSSAIMFITNWAPFVNTIVHHWLTCASRSLVNISSRDLVAVRGRCWAKHTRARYPNLTPFLLNCSYFDLIRAIMFSRLYWRIGDLYFGSSNYPLPEDGESSDGYSAQPSSGQWTGSSSSHNRTGVGVWSHGSFNTGDPPALLLWEEVRLNYLRWLESEARDLGYTLVPLPRAFPRSSDQPTDQVSLPPAPPFPLPSQPWLSPFVVPRQGNRIDYAMESVTPRIADGRDTAVLDSSQRGL